MTGLDEEERRTQAYRRLGETVYFWLRRFYAKLDTQPVPGVTGYQFFVLMAIARRCRLTVSELAEELGVSLSAVSGLTDRLAALGFVVRQRDQADRRLVRVQLTARGREVADAFVQRRKILMSRYFDRMPLEEVELVSAAMDKLRMIFLDD